MLCLFYVNLCKDHRKTDNHIKSIVRNLTTNAHKFPLQTPDMNREKLASRSQDRRGVHISDGVGHAARVLAGIVLQRGANDEARQAARRIVRALVSELVEEFAGAAEPLHSEGVALHAALEHGRTPLHKLHSATQRLKHSRPNHLRGIHERLDRVGLLGGRDGESCEKWVD